MGNTRNTGYLQNAIKVSDAGAISFMSGSTMLATINTSGQMSGSSPVLFAATASFVANAQTASFVALAQSASNAVAAQTASFANAFTVANTLTAQTLVVQTITSSVDFVTGSTRFGSLSSNTMQVTGSLLISGSSTAFAVNNNALFVSSSGFVGIGTTTFSNGNFSNSAVGLNISASAPISLLRDATGNTFYMGLTLNAYLGTQNAIPMYFLTSDTIRMTITSGGNLGIGYTLPTVALQVSGTIAVGNATTTGWGRFSYDVATNQVRIQASKDGTDPVPISFYTQASGGGFAERMIISGSNVGIGTSTPSYALDINDTSGSGVRGMRISTSSSSVGPSIILRYAPGGLTNWLIGTSQAVSNTLEFIASNSVSGDPGTAGTTRMLITSGGNVLIGTTTSNNFNFVASPSGHSFLGNTMQISAGDYGGTERQGAFGVAEWANEQSPVINLASVFPRITFSSRALSVLVQIGTSNNSTSQCSALVLFSRTINSGWSSTVIANINNGGTSLNSVSGSGTSITLNFNNFNFGSAMITILNRA
jgi:hypothetical protein